MNLQERALRQRGLINQREKIECLIHGIEESYSVYMTVEYGVGDGIESEERHLNIFNELEAIEDLSGSDIFDKLKKLIILELSPVLDSVKRQIEELEKQ